MKKKIQLGLFISVMVLMMSSLTVNAKDNDGKAKDNPVCDSGFPSNFKDATYYDMAIPYALTNEEIGGFATGGKGVMSDAVKKEYAGQHWNREGDHTSKTEKGVFILYSTVRNSPNLKIADNSDGFCVATDTNGTEYLILALPKFCYNSSAQIQWGTANRGQICEIYFTDGKFLRVIVGDAKAEEHTNGGGGTYYQMSPLNYSQYACLYQAHAGETFEWFCTSSTSSKLADMAGSSGQASYVRMYNLNVTSAVPTLANGVGKGFNGSSESSGANLGDSNQSEANSKTGYAGGEYAEMSSIAYNKLCEDNFASGVLSEATRDNLTTEERQGINNWERNINEDSQQGGLIYWIRVAIAIFAIILIIWAVLLYLAYWIDKMNTLIDFENGFLGLFSFGKFRVSDNEDECTYRMSDTSTHVVTVNHKAILKICLVTIIFAILILTGTLYKLIAVVINKALTFFA